MIETPAVKPSVSLRKHYLPLDGLRGVAIVAVFLAHYPLFRFVTQWGWTGVDLFFTLSGFLISGILYDQLDSNQFFKNFYIRRSFRIFPLYFGFWLFVGCIIPVFHLQWYEPLWAWLAYLGNFLPLVALSSGHTIGFYETIHSSSPNGIRIMLVHFWTLCVEEQFYLVWPFVVWFLRKRRTLMTVCVLIIPLSLIARILATYLLRHSPLGPSAFVGRLMPLRCEALMLGSLLALWVRPNIGFERLPAKRIYGASLAAFAGLVVSAFSFPRTGGEWSLEPWMASYGLTLVALVAIGILVASLREPGFARLLSWPPLASLGRISYGFYILHLLPLDFLHSALASRATRFFFTAASFLISYILSWLSFRFFESPFLKLKDRLAPKQAIRTSLL